MKNKTEIVANTKIVSELKENKKQTMDSIYTTNKEYSDGTTLLETVTLEDGKAMIVDGKPKIETKTTININWDDKGINTFSVYSSNFVTMVYGPIAAF
jgi:ribosomal protein S4E